MSTNTDLITLATADLCRIHGGDGNNSTGRTEGVSAQLIPGTRISGQNHYSNYEVCLVNNRRQAREAYPDTRNLWEQLTGGVDRNARARADYERGGMTNCAATLPRG